MINWCEKKRCGGNDVSLKAELSIRYEKSHRRIKFSILRDAYVRYFSSAESIMVGFDTSMQRMYVCGRNDKTGYKVGHQEDKNINPSFVVSTNNLPDNVSPSALQGSYKLYKDEEGYLYVQIGAKPY